MNFTKFPINQSLIRMFLHNGNERDFCYRKIYLTRIEKSVKEVPSDAMLYGKYFETKCLGKSSGYDVHDLPRKKLTKAMIAENVIRKKEKQSLILGEKYLDHERVDQQIMRFKALVSKYKMIIADNNVQVPILAVWDQDPDVLLKAELDIFPTTILLPDDDNVPKLFAAIIDLKLTADIHNEHGEYCYGKPEYLDLIQAKMYHYVIRNMNLKLNPHMSELIGKAMQSLIDKNAVEFLLWIFNYKKTELEDKFIRVRWDRMKEAELHESIRKTISRLNEGEANDWPTNPKYEICKYCPWKDCPDKIKIQTI